MECDLRTGALTSRPAKVASLCIVQGSSGLASALPLTGFLFGCICYREILMDINDIAGDSAAGVRTLPVVMSSMRALAVAAGSLLAAYVAGMKGLATAGGLSAFTHVVPPTAVKVVLQVLLTLGVWPALQDVIKIRRSHLDPQAVSAAISNSFRPIAAGLVLLSVC